MQRYLRAALSILALAAVLFSGASIPSARAQPGDVDVSVFYDELEQYGRWFTHSRYGYVWSPDVDDDWRPYSRGHWVYTEDHGWYWEAEEPWGWGPFHYGRWVLDEDSGWIWIPGTEWGPAWVAWRYSDDYVGWAPLPPEAEWYEDRGLSFSSNYYDHPRFAPFWIFVSPRYLTSPGLHRYAVPHTRNRFIIGRTRWATSYRSIDRRIFNAGFDVRHYERVTRRPLGRVHVVSVNSPRGLGFQGGDRRTLHAFRPRLVAGPNPPRPPRLVDPPRRQWGGSERGPVVRPGFTPHEKGLAPSHRGGPPSGPSGGTFSQPSQPQLWKRPQTGTHVPKEPDGERPLHKQRPYEKGLAPSQRGDPPPSGPGGKTFSQPSQPQLQPKTGTLAPKEPDGARQQRTQRPSGPPPQAGQGAGQASQQFRQPGHPPSGGSFKGEPGKGEAAKKKKEPDPNQPQPPSSFQR